MSGQTHVRGKLARRVEHAPEKKKEAKDTEKCLGQAARKKPPQRSAAGQRGISSDLQR